MPLVLAIPKETRTQEQRVAMVPSLVKRFKDLGVEIYLQSNAGSGIFAKDASYQDVHIIKELSELYKMADIILKVQPPAEDELGHMKPNTVLISFLEPYNSPNLIKKLCAKKITGFSMEMIPRISRAQTMDALTSQASLAGYKGVLIAANIAPRFFPMMTTAAGTVRPSKVLVIGIGVAGLQAIATAHRLGALVEAYDVRPETKEQAESVGARFIQIDVAATGTGGYARELTPEEKKKQEALLAKHIIDADVVICTAGVPGKPAPQIIQKNIVQQMKPGSVIVDIVAEYGGNCELTQPNKTIQYQGVTISGPINISSSLAIPASEMFTQNLLNLLRLMIKDGKITLDWDDEIIKKTAVTYDGKVCNEQILNLIKETKHD